MFHSKHPGNLKHNPIQYMQIQLIYTVDISNIIMQKWYTDLSTAFPSLGSSQSDLQLLIQRRKDGSFFVPFLGSFLSTG